ncbi:MAG TPA: tRNA uridine(34) 5-carboxymethylaminomethyl modification radical SAM/GNAT enzyme Elp3 [Candidatus Methanoperedenaceae archaeon]|nr:tRNA uridine(34) 5-carboxymethylaminomethyl modification radical SAM/GNAT enzyme Elp3 [Candidatus Methanoperedenaceae archaeon]
MSSIESACRDLIEDILAGNIADEAGLCRAKKKVSLQCRLDSLPGNPEILSYAREGERERVLEVLQRKPVRTISGVAVIAAMTSPAPCPHGKCVPCPGGPDSKFRSPLSYMGLEPAARRAFECGFDPYVQVSSRLRQLSDIGHPVDKAELIIMGGTFTARPPQYQEWFVRRCLEAMNEFGGSSKGGSRSVNTIEEAQAVNETSRVRNVGMTVETRPDWMGTEHIDGILRLGATKVELGVQSTDDGVLLRIRRGHTVAQSVTANRLVRDSGLKVGFHMMPGLPGSSMEKDARMFEDLFSDERFMPDYLKIYPTLVTEGTELAGMYDRSEYEPPGTEEAAQLVGRIKSILPVWTRLQRVQRDIPAPQILAGVKKSNLRQLAGERLGAMGKSCRCIRCREVGHRALHGVEPGNIELGAVTYRACGGIEHFISFEDRELDVLIGFLRLRFPASPHSSELSGSALVRELHVYGPLVPLKTRAKEAEWQHRGYGEELLIEAERMAAQAGFKKIAVTSGIGVREYYRRLGYRRDGPYMAKTLRDS